MELRSVARSGRGGKDMSGTVKNTQHSGVTFTFPNIQWMGIKELLENIKCYLAAEIVVTHFQLNHFRSCNHFKVPEVTILGYLVTQVKQNDRQLNDCQPCNIEH